MERAVNVLGDCGEARRIRSRRPKRLSLAGRAPAIAFLAALALVALAPATTSAQTSAPGSPKRALSRPGSPGASRPVPLPAPADRAKVDDEPPRPPAPPAALAKAEAPPAPRFKVRDQFDQCVVARLHAQYGDKVALILPDGQLGTSNFLVPTEEPFRPLTSDQLEALLHENKGPFADFQLLKSDHYLIFFKSTRAFAEDSGRLLEALYRGLVDAFRRSDIPVNETEFPLVAVIFATERDFREHKAVDHQIRAYYEYYTNRIFFFEKSKADAIEPKVAALLKPQTVAHEGAHQILSNIGVQPRPNTWPLWLVEGLAEYCATTCNSKKGIVWSGLGAINSLHMATIRELEDPLSKLMSSPPTTTRKVARKEFSSQSETLLLKTSLSPTDYAEAWTLTHYLAQKRGREFVNYLKAMNQISPLEPRTPEANLTEFRKFFTEAPNRLDKRLSEHIHKLSQKRAYDSLYYYAIVFEQRLDNGLVRRAATFSQSPQIIQEWVQEMTSPTGEIPTCEAKAWSTRAQAELAIQQWIRGY